MSVNVDRFFGAGACFYEATETYCAKALPAFVVQHAATLGRARIAYCLGYAFACAVNHRKMKISDEELESVSQRATSENPAEFINGFRRFTP